ncbi:MAG: MG2 domain-containing protein [Flavobacteriales bacterium]
MRRLPPFLLLFAFALFTVTCNTPRQVSKGPAQEKDPRWLAVDSLSEQGLYASALERTELILSDAQEKGDWRVEFQAWTYRMAFQRVTGVEVDSSLRAMEARAATSGTPLKQLLHSELAESWWERYRSQRWMILERTNMQEEGDDPATWTQATFMAKVIAHYRASLDAPKDLKAIPVGELGPLLAGGKDIHLRPTLFDLLAHRALAVYRNSETRLSEPAWRFTLDDPRDFDLFEPFIFRQLQHRDSTAWEFQAMRLYQSLEHAHLSDDAPDALVDVTLQRLDYVHERSTLPEKDSLYLRALGTLQSRVINDSCWAEVIVAIARWHAEQGEKYQRLAGDAWKWEKRTARALCDSAIVRYPGSFGATNAMAMKARLERGALAVHIEEAVAPEAAFTMGLSYTNTPKVHLRVVKDPVQINGEHRQDREEWLTKQKAVREWSVALPDDGDLNEHVIELPVEGLPFGHYTILVSDSSSFTYHQDIIAYASFWSTNMAMVDRYHGKDLDLLVLDRTSGSPKEGVKAMAYVRNRDQTGIRRFIGVSEFSTDKEGMVRTDLKGEKGEVLWSLKEGNDEYISGSRWMYPYEREEQEHVRTYLFTDRAIYRPGQTIFFKGIVVAQNGTNNMVKAGFKSTVRFHDANGQQVDTLVVTTDAYGSYHGSFTAPMAALTGRMLIDDGQGTAAVQVEEYWQSGPPSSWFSIRPGSTAKLGQEATVSGVAKSYAGAPLDGAKVCGP